MPAVPCSFKSCKTGHLEEWGSGELADGRAVTWSICDTCGRTVEDVNAGPDLSDHPTLFEEAADA